MKRLWLLLLVPLGLLLVPPAAQADCATPELPVVGCPLPGASATPTPTPAPTAVPSPTSSPARESPTPGDTVTFTHTDPPPPGAELVPSLPLGGGLVTGPRPSPSVAITPVVSTAASAPAATAIVSPLSGVVASSFAIVVFGLLAIPLLLGFLAGLRPVAPAHPSYGGTAMRNRARLWTGLGVLAAAAVVGGVGWYRVSGEPLLNRQIPFLASAGIVVVLLSVLGGSLIIAEQLRGDQHRMGELEDAVRALTEALAPAIERAPRIDEPATEVLVRGRARSRRASAGST